MVSGDIEVSALAPEDLEASSPARPIPFALCALAGTAALVAASTRGAVAPTRPRTATHADVARRLDRFLLENARGSLERQWGSGGPPPGAEDGEGSGGSGPHFAFLDAERFCCHLAAFARDAAQLSAPLSNSVIPWSYDGDKFDILGYERQLRSWLFDVEAKEKLRRGAEELRGPTRRRKNVFVLCTVNEEARYLFLLEERDVEGGLHLRASLWHVDESSRQVYPVPPHVETCKLKLRQWLERQHYELRGFEP